MSLILAVILRVTSPLWQVENNAVRADYRTFPTKTPYSEPDCYPLLLLVIRPIVDSTTGAFIRDLDDTNSFRIVDDKITITRYH